MSWNVKCQMSWNVKCHEMSNVMKCQMSWNADAGAGSMTPSRNTRRYTLRSVPSSPGRSFCSSFLPLFIWNYCNNSLGHKCQHVPSHWGLLSGNYWFLGEINNQQSGLKRKSANFMNGFLSELHKLFPKTRGYLTLVSYGRNTNVWNFSLPKVRRLL